MEEEPRPQPKFTKGEKCIFSQIVFTLVFCLILILIYIIHLFAIRHTPYNSFAISRRHKGNLSDDSDVPLKLNNLNLLVGVVTVKMYDPLLICNSVLLKPLWSLTSAHCVIARSDPDASNTLPYWRVMYVNERNSEQETSIRRSIPHPHFSTDDFANNLGLMEHESPLYTGFYVSPGLLRSSDINNNDDIDPLFVEAAGWPDFSFNDSFADREIKLSRQLENVYIMTSDQCSDKLSSIAKLKEYELCGETEGKYFNCQYSHGIAIFQDENLVGFSSWGEKCDRRGMPLIFTKISPYLEWIQDVTSLERLP